MSEGKYRYFKCNFDEKTNYAHKFGEKRVLLWCDKNEINDEFIRRKETDICRKFKFLFFSWFHRAKMWYAKCKLLPSNQQTFFIESYITDFKSYIYISIQDRLSFLISKSVLYNFAEKLLATLICLWCTVIVYAPSYLGIFKGIL